MNREYESVYNSMRFSAALNIVLGIVLLTTGIVSGILLLISAGRLMNGKSRILF